MESVKSWLSSSPQKYTTSAPKRTCNVGCGEGNAMGAGNFYNNTGDCRCNGFELPFHDLSNNEDDGYGYGDGIGCGDLKGFGSHSCYVIGKIKNFCNHDVYKIDSMQTIITHIKDSFAKGFIINSDFTLTPCYIVKNEQYFAHGRTLHEAVVALNRKRLANRCPEDIIDEFRKKFEKDKRYPGTDFFEWHHYLTGSCLMGREKFVEDNGLDLKAEYSVNEFIALCENDYGGEIITMLKEYY